MPDFKFNLGDRAKDNITQFKGLIVSRTQWLNQCNTYGLQSEKLGKDGTPTSKQWFDEPQLELVKAEVQKKSQKTGGPSGEVPQTNRM